MGTCFAIAKNGVRSNAMRWILSKDKKLALRRRDTLD